MLDTGAPCLLRYRYLDGSVQAALPMRIVEDRPERTVAWLASGTPIRYWATRDGGDPRALPLDRRFAGPLANGPKRWSGPGVLHVMLPGHRYQVVHFRRPDDGFAHWYVDVESPLVRTGDRFDTIDHHLDLVIRPDLSAEWKDEDEAEAAVGTAHLRAEDLAAARATGEALVAAVDGWPGEVGDWRGFRPDPAWSVPALPEDWDEPPPARFGG